MQSQVLTDRIPFYEYNDNVVMFHIAQGGRPKKPTFANTRGYTEEPWDMTTHCLDLDPSKRPTIDHVLDKLITAAEQWQPKHEGVSTQDDWNPTVSEEVSDSATVLEPKNEPVDDTSSSNCPPQSLVVETPRVPTPDPAPPSVSSPSTVKEPIQLGSTLVTSKKEETKPASAIPPKEEEPRPNTVISRKGMEPTLARPSGEEGCKPISVPSSDKGTRVAPVVSPKQEKPKLALVTSKDEVTRSAPDRRSRELSPTSATPIEFLPVRQSTEEESKPTLVISKKEEIQHAPARLSEAQPKSVPAASKDEIKEGVPLKSTPLAPRKGNANPALVGPFKEVSPELNPATPRKEAVSSTTVSPRKQGLPSCSRPATSLGDDKHTSIDASKAEIRSELIPDTLKEGAEGVPHKWTAVSEKQEAMPATTRPPGEEGVSRPASNQGETKFAYPQKVGPPQPKEQPTGCEQNPQDMSMGEGQNGTPKVRTRFLRTLFTNENPNRL